MKGETGVNRCSQGCYFYPIILFRTGGRFSMVSNEGIESWSTEEVCYFIAEKGLRKTL